VKRANIYLILKPTKAQFFVKAGIILLFLGIVMIWALALIFEDSSKNDYIKCSDLA
jgi:hypothetical protein